MHGENSTSTRSRRFLWDENRATQPSVRRSQSATTPSVAADAKMSSPGVVGTCGARDVELVISRRQSRGDAAATTCIIPSRNAGRPRREISARRRDGDGVRRLGVRVCDFARHRRSGRVEDAEAIVRGRGHDQRRVAIS